MTMSAYASGDGGLTIYKKDKRYEQGYTYDGISLEMVKEYRDREFPNWRIYFDGSYYRLYRPMVRVNNNTLKDSQTGDLYEYELFEGENKIIKTIWVLTPHPEVAKINGNRIETKNLSIRGRIRFFIDNEPYLTKNTVG